MSVSDILTLEGLELLEQIELRLKDLFHIHRGHIGIIYSK